MVGNLLKQSSLPRESTSAHLHPAELDSIINQAIRRITLIAPPGVRVEASLQALQNTQLSAPQSILESALDALLENAVQHAASRVLIGCEMAGRTVCLLVDDDGPGIAPVHREAVMAPFARAESGRGSQGSGLGLAIASTAVKQLGGSLVIEDSPLGGARLRLEFEPERPVNNVIS
jgi:signal transduction histidine kinase